LGEFLEDLIRDLGDPAERSFAPGAAAAAAAQEVSVPVAAPPVKSVVPSDRAAGLA
jgi:hypothetical protein